jgi:hypothetical protein
VATLDEVIHYEAPEGWLPTPQSDFRRVTLQVQDGAQSAETTALGLPGTATRLLPNVNLWRRQIGLDDTTQADLDKAVAAIEVGGRRGHYIKLEGASGAEHPRAMLVVLVSDQDRTWLFKMLGDSALVLREQERFLAFVGSVTFVPAGPDQVE